jgi:hypothetical protein
VGCAPKPGDSVMDLQRAMSWAVFALVGTVLATQAYVDMELSTNIWGWHANAPVVDLAGLALLAVAVAAWQAGMLSGLQWRPPAPAAWLAFLLIAAVGLPGALFPQVSVHAVVRRAVFAWLVYGVALSLAAATLLPAGRLRALVLFGAGVTAAVSIGTSVLRIVGGDTLWYQPLAHLTPNHKTLAVSLAGWLPLVIAWARGHDGVARTSARVVALAATVAVALSLSKTAMLAAAFAIGWHWPTRRPLATRLHLVLPALVGGALLAYYSPLLIDSKVMLDAARSRHSLNERAWMLFSAHPLLGAGLDANTQVELVTFPHYRVNGVDAHGVIQKIASETGLLGLLAWCSFTVSVGRRLWQRRHMSLGTHAALGTFLGLHLQLLVSTETFAPTHWVPLAICWGLSFRDPEVG